MYFHDDDDDDDDDDDSESDLKFQLISNTFTKRTGDTETIISYKWSHNSKIVKEFKGS